MQQTVTSGDIVRRAGWDWGNNGEKYLLCAFLFYFNFKSIYYFNIYF